MKLDGSKILVTGGAGFIGSHLTERLLGMGASVTVYDRFDDFYAGKERNLAGVAEHPQFRLVKGDILDAEKLDSVMDGVDVVFHEAGQAGIGFSVKHPRQVNLVNVDGTLNVLSLARRHKVRRVVNASSSSIFGQPEYLPIDEAHPTNPTSPYGVSKLAAEQYGRAFYRVYGTDVVSLRYFSVYGPRGRPDQVIDKFTKSLMAGKSPIIQGDGSHTRDFTYVTDIVAANLAAAQCDEGLGGEVFNIGFGSRASVLELAEKLIRIIRPDGKISPTYVGEGPAEFPHTQASNRKAGEMLHWEPKVGLDEGLKMFVDWFNMSTTVKGEAR
ncbi:MAG: NAD-dependent epimerase/dehydratase family protein [Thaumarchaeota archaeon]|nr:NAD-dependent epimerase/dehydratase family protein [Nitrososphaerota archaeon]